MKDFSQTSSFQVFDHSARRLRYPRLANNRSKHSALFDEIGEQLRERLQDVKRDFTSVLDYGGQTNLTLKSQNAFSVAACFVDKVLGRDNNSVVSDPEYLPFAAASFDLVVSNSVLHWVNDLPGALLQICHILKPEGLFLATMLGGRTLQELRDCLVDAELAVAGGISPRLSPTLALQDASNLLQRAGFHLPVADTQSVTMIYSDMFALMHDLRGMGEANAHIQRLRRPTRRAVFDMAARLYQERYSATEGGIFATFEVIFLHGWA